MSLTVSLLAAVAVGGLLSHLTARAVAAGHFPRYPRTLHRVWARLGGYFWLPCPACLRRFGGHEWRASNVTGSSWIIDGHVTCPVCTGRCDVLAVLDREGHALLVPWIAGAAGMPRRRVRRAIMKLLDMRYVEALRLAPTGREHYRITDSGRRVLADATRRFPDVMSRARGSIVP